MHQPAQRLHIELPSNAHPMPVAQRYLHYHLRPRPAGNASGTTSTGTNDGPDSRDSSVRHLASRRRVNTKLVFTSCRRATSATVTPGIRVCATIWRFSSSVYRRRLRPSPIELRPHHPLVHDEHPPPHRPSTLRPSILLPQGRNPRTLTYRQRCCREFRNKHRLGRWRRAADTPVASGSTTRAIAATSG